jgi:hypothetical protein
MPDLPLERRQTIWRRTIELGQVMEIVIDVMITNIELRLHGKLLLHASQV